MKGGLVIADAGPIFSLAIIDRLDILTNLFSEIRIATAVWDEITLDSSVEHYQRICQFFKERTVSIRGFNELVFLMDKGESESVILYRELNADFLLIDDRKARQIAENLGLRCIGTIGILSVAKKKKLLAELRPIFLSFLENNRYYSVKLLNSVLAKSGEKPIPPS